MITKNKHKVTGPHSLSRFVLLPCSFFFRSESAAIQLAAEEELITVAAGAVGAGEEVLGEGAAVASVDLAEAVLAEAVREENGN